MTRLNKDLIIGNSNTRLESLIPYVLYNNDSGSNDNIVLSDIVSNYKYIDIYFKNIDGNYNYVRAFNPSGKTVDLTSHAVISDQLVSVHSRTVYLINNNINTVNFCCLTRWGTWSKSELEYRNLIWITQVIGYK